MNFVNTLPPRMGETPFSYVCLCYDHGGYFLATFNFWKDRWETEDGKKADPIKWVLLPDVSIFLTNNTF